jgi:hypothetical protein
MLTADQIFSNKAETWLFKNGWGDTTTIEVIPVDANHTTWHYTKTAARAYWLPSVEQAENWFDLERDSTGAWYSTGGVDSMPVGCNWCDSPFVNMRYPVVTKDGYPRPYLILPAKADYSYDTVLDDTIPWGQGVLKTFPNTTWKTSSYMEYVSTPVFKGFAYVSDQWEGTCVHEKWYFAPGLGLVKVVPFIEGSCEWKIDPNVTMVRVN